MITINLETPELTKERVKEIVRQNVPELEKATLHVSKNSSGEWHWCTNTSTCRYDWSGFVHPDGRLEGPY